MNGFMEKRSSGILMPISSLPGKYGIGSFGNESYRFVDFLASSEQQYWQILPIGPTGYGDSPYQSFSAFSGNPYFIDLDTLQNMGLLTPEECAEAERPVQSVDYAWLYETRLPLLRVAAARMPETQEYQTFCAENHWLDDYALFMAIKGAYGDVSWQQWPDALRMREDEAMKQAQAEYAAEIICWKKLQCLFYAQWKNLKAYANKKNIQMIGDIPIYVSPDSSDVWASPHLFQLDARKRQTIVAGVPPDAFSADGQLWGNPLYAWERHAADKFAWWKSRMCHAASIYDVTRIDHFRGLCDYFAIPAGDTTAKNGGWMPGPGMAFVRAIRNAIPDISIIAEDLGYLSPEVEQLLHSSGFPGMKVLQFAFDSRESGDYLPFGYQRNSVVYTGTHDNTTTADWEFSAPPQDVEYAKQYLYLTPEQSLTEGMVRTAFASASALAVIPLQDWLETGVEGRINKPSTLGGNWIWRVEETIFEDAALREKIAALTRLYHRNPEPSTCY